MGRRLAVGVEKWGLYGQLRLVHHADTAGPAGLVEKCSLAINSSAGTTDKWLLQPVLPTEVHKYTKFRSKGWMLLHKEQLTRRLHVRLVSPWITAGWDYEADASC